MKGGHDRFWALHVDRPAAVSGLTPLLLAAARGHVEIVKELIQAGASNDVKDNAGLGLRGLIQ